MELYSARPRCDFVHGCSQRDKVAMAERSEGKEYEFTDNLNDITNLLEEMVEQDELRNTRSSSNLNKCDSEQLNAQEETPVVSKVLNNLSNVCGMAKFINEKNCETFNKPAKCSMDSQQNFFNHLLKEIQFLREEARMKNIIIKSLLLSKSSKHNEQNLAYKTTNDNFYDENSVQFNICSKDDSPKGNSQGNNGRSDKIVLKHKIFKKNLFKVCNDHTADEKTSNEYSDDELINFNLLSTATNASNLSSINKNNSNDCDITKAYEEKTVEAVLANSVPISVPNKEANFHLAETIDSTIDQFKALIEKARKFTVDNDFTARDRAHSSSKKSEGKVEETHTWRKGTTLIMGNSNLSHIRKEKLCKKGTIKVRCFSGAKFEYFYHYTIPLITKKPDCIVLRMGTNNAPYCTPEKMVDQILRLKNIILQKLSPVRLLFLLQR